MLIVFVWERPVKTFSIIHAVILYVSVCRRIYLAYMDSVHFFKPRQFRTAVYHEILIGYLDYVKLLGYVSLLLYNTPLLAQMNLFLEN